MVESKVGFDRLKRMNEEIRDQKIMGNNTQHLEQEKQNLQKSVMKQFKEYQNVAAAHKEMNEYRDEEENEQISRAWKHAATEICDILHKVRHENEDQVAALQKKIDGFVKNMEMQASQIKRLKAEIKSKELLGQKWQDDCVLVTNEKAQLGTKVASLKKELASTRKKMSKIQEGGGSAEDEDYDDYYMDGGRPVVTGGRVGTNNDPATLRAQLRDCQKQVDTLTEDVKHYQEKSDKMSSEADELRDDIQRLEQDKTELLHQMKQASVRPDVRRLSQTGSIQEHARSKHNIVGFPGGTVSGVAISKLKDQTSSDPSSTGSDHSLYALQSYATIIGAGETDGKDATGKPIRETNNERALKAKIEELHKQLTKAHHEMREMKLKLYTDDGNLRSPTPVNPDQPDATVFTGGYVTDTTPSGTVISVPHVSEQLTALRAKQADKEKPTSTRPRQSQKASQERQERILRISKQREIERLAAAEKEKEEVKPAPPPEPVEPEIVYIRIMESKEGEITLTNTSMQTDIKQDPFGAWSQAAAAENSGWQPPLPPTQWLEFDPTCTEGPQSADSKPVKTIGDQMLACVEPGQVHKDTLDCANFMQRELSRMKEGIQSFVEFTNRLVDKEAKHMSIANKELRDQLSKFDLEKLEKDLKLTSPGSNQNLFGITPTMGTSSGSSRSGARSGAISDLNKKHRIQQGGLAAAVARQPNKSELISTSQTLLTPTSMSPVEDRIKYQVTRIGHDAYNTLKRTYDVIFAALQSQHRQYEHIFTLMKPHLIAKEKEMSLSKSKSHQQMTVPQIEIKVAVSGVKIDSLSRVHSAMSVQSAASLDLTSQPSRIKGDRSGRYAAMNKEELHVSMATTPKTGLITLTTGREETYTSATDLDRARRKVRPAPMNHKKLLIKQKQLLQEDIPTEKPKDAMQRRNINTKYELPSDFFGGYTVRDLERTVGTNMPDLKTRDRQQSIATTIQTVVRLPKLEQANRAQKFLSYATPEQKEDKDVLEEEEEVKSSSLPPLNTEWMGVITNL